MDPLGRAYYEMAYKLAFSTKKADEFQDFFSSIMEKRYPADFTRVRPWGGVGDRKCDGYRRSTRTLFQVYAPDKIQATRTIAKIEADFTGALPHWEAHFDTWVFVHNSTSGLAPDVLRRLLDLGEQHDKITVTHWGIEELRQEVFGLRDEELASLLGPAPSHQGMVDLGLAELAPVLDQLAVMPAPDSPDLRPVPAEKLQRNMLSDHVATLLRAGMSRADLIGRFFSAQPTRQDRIAEAFRVRYLTLRSSGAGPDEIFAALQRYAGGGVLGAPSRQNAVLATLAFFFETCDIFERPEPGGSDL